MSAARDSTEACKSPQPQLDIMVDWTCDQLNEFNALIRAYSIEGYILKSIQMAIFAAMILLLIVQRCNGKKRIGALPIFIAVLGLMNSVFAIVRIKVLYPFYASHKAYIVIFTLENIGYFGTTWLFGVRYYETALDIEQIVCSSADD